MPAIDPWLAEADLLLLTSAYEGYPSVLIEAIAAGVPVVTTPSSPAIPEILFSPRFGLVSAADPTSLAEAAVSVLQGPPIDDGARNMLIEGHRADRSAARWLEMLDRVVAERIG